MSEVGFAGTTVSFVNFRDELPYFIATVLPLLREAGLRKTNLSLRGAKRRSNLGTSMAPDAIPLTVPTLIEIASSLRSSQ